MTAWDTFCHGICRTVGVLRFQSGTRLGLVAMNRVLYTEFEKASAAMKMDLKYVHAVQGQCYQAVHVQLLLGCFNVERWRSDRLHNT